MDSTSEAISDLNNETVTLTDEERQSLESISGTAGYNAMMKLLKLRQQSLIYKLIQADQSKTLADGLRGAIEELGGIEARVNTEIQKMYDNEEEENQD